MVASAAGSDGDAALDASSLPPLGVNGTDELRIPVRLNNTPHPREVRRQFYADANRSFAAAYAAGEKRMQMKVEFPELNTEQDVYRVASPTVNLRSLRCHC